MKHAMIEINREMGYPEQPIEITVNSIDKANTARFWVTAKQARALCEALFLFLDSEGEMRYFDDFIRAIRKPVKEQDGTLLSSRGIGCRPLRAGG